MASKKRSDDAATPNPVAVRIAEIWHQGGKGSEVPLDRIEAELEGVARYDIVAALRALEKGGDGKFIAGKRGNKARFVWSGKANAVAPVKAKPALARAAKVASPKLDKGAPAREAGPRLLEHAFYVRAGVLAKLQLPEDVTLSEIERLCHFLQAIPFR